MYVQLLSTTALERKDEGQGLPGTPGLANHSAPHGVAKPVFLGSACRALPDSGREIAFSFELTKTFHRDLLSFGTHDAGKIRISGEV